MIAAHHQCPRDLADRRAREQRGVAVVEAALVVPIFLVLLLGMVDIGLGVFQTSQATSAAADGARTGIVRSAEADVPSSDSGQAIREAISKRLPGQAFQYRAECLTREVVGGVAVDKVIGCGVADPEVDRLRVSVWWRFRPISPVGYSLPVQDISASAAMGLIDQPK